MSCFVWIAIACFIGLIYSAPTEKKTCGYQSCHPIKDGYINVHIVAHTHDDVGWLKTVDQYYYGSNSTIQRAGVQYILDSVLDSLIRNPDRRFIYVETAFLWKWWIQQHDIVKAQFRKLINSGQLEIIGGAWSMNDEATTHYHSIIDQFTWGMRKLNESFGYCARPKIGWQIDPFGHSREMASIFSQLGFDGVFLGRIDYQDKATRFSTNTPEFIWQGSQSLGNTSNIFTGILYNTYNPPPGFCFDILCNDEPLVESRRSPLYNIGRKVDDFLEYVKNMTKVYRTSNVLITMGNDFHYQDANVWFKNLDKLIRHVNARQENGSRYNLLYSTPSCYLKAVHEESVKTVLKWYFKTDDFFPYASDQHAYWTGYFTSRPTLKRYERVGNNFLQVCKQLYALADLGPEDRADLNVLREAMGVMQHHDAVTGTEKQHVASDYARILYDGFEECNIAVSAALRKLSNGSSLSPSDLYNSCQFNISECEFTEKKSTFIVTVYNPLSRPVSHYVRIPVIEDTYDVRGPDGYSMVTEMIPIPQSTINIPGRISSATYELLFRATDIPPLGFKSYYVSKSTTKLWKYGQRVDEGESNELGFKNKYVDVGFTFDQATGLLASVKMNGKEIPISQDFSYYIGTVGDNNVAENRASGAYIFRPNTSEAYNVSKKASISIYRGQFVAELRQTFDKWVSQVIRVYHTENFVEFDWLIGPIPMTNDGGKEVITRYSTNLKTNAMFYTDSNGREMLKRVRNFRPTWRVDLKENVSGNYYPVTSKISIRDPHEGLQVSVLTDRAEGGTSLKDGQIELMLHRRCAADDAFGVDEALNETAYGTGLVARGSHYLVAGSYVSPTGEKSLFAQEKDIAQRKLLSAWTFLSSHKGLSFEEYRAKHPLQYDGLTRALPDNVQILTLEPWTDTSLLLRLEHVFEANEDTNQSLPVIVDLENLFTSFRIVSLKETTLGANQWLDENKRLSFEGDRNLQDLFKADNDKWHRWAQSQLNSNEIDAYLDPPGVKGQKSLQITLKPMQIRTFVINIRRK